jgi:hypothetical protein
MASVVVVRGTAGLEVKAHATTDEGTPARAAKVPAMAADLPVAAQMDAAPTVADLAASGVDLTALPTAEALVPVGQVDFLVLLVEVAVPVDLTAAFVVDPEVQAATSTSAWMRSIASSTKSSAKSKSSSATAADRAAFPAGQTRVASADRECGACLECQGCPACEACQGCEGWVRE